MELIISDENFFDPTPKLKSSPMPISFILFCDDWDNSRKCFRRCRCVNEYSLTILSYKRYCKNCLSKYISHIIDDNIYLDVHIVTKNVQCDKHEVARNTDFRTQKIQEWCETCSDILCFKQIYVQL